MRGVQPAARAVKQLASCAADRRYLWLDRGSVTRFLLEQDQIVTYVKEFPGDVI